MTRQTSLPRASGDRISMCTASRSGNHCHGRPERRPRYGRTLAIVVAGSASILLTLRPGPVHGAGYGCAEEYLGLIAGVHWYDVWKTCNGSTCFGHVIEGVPFDEDGLFLCSSGGPCVTANCVQGLTLYRTTTEEETLQEAIADKNEKFEKKGKHPDDLSYKSEGFALIKGATDADTYAFKLLSITTKYPGEKPKTRLIGVEIDPKQLDPMTDVIRRAKWSKNEPAIGLPSTKSKVQHFVDVEKVGANTSLPFPSGETERYRVCTAKNVTHSDQ